MLHGMNLAVTVTATAVTILAAVYLWSEDPGRRPGPGTAQASAPPLNPRDRAMFPAIPGRRPPEHEPGGPPVSSGLPALAIPGRAMGITPDTSAGASPSGSSRLRARRSILAASHIQLSRIVNGGQCLFCASNQ